jgi:multidrug efflux pump subunit AcrA (membrane-fusion protein)
MMFVTGGLFAQEVSVSRDAIWVDTVKRGPMVRAVRGSGTVASATSVTLNLPEKQMEEVRSGQVVEIDPKVSPSLNGRVARLNPVVNGVGSVVVSLLEPTNIAPGTHVDGTIELQRLSDAVYVGRPVSVRPNSDGELFRIEADGVHAAKVRVRFGGPSVKTVQILEGLEAGDKVILSDTTAYEKYDRIALHSGAP